MIFKRGKTYWMDAVVNGVRYRESLKTTDRRLAPGLERELVGQLMNRAPDPTQNSKAFRTLELAEAMKAYIKERRSQVSERMVAYWIEQARPLSRAPVQDEVDATKSSRLNVTNRDVSL